MFTIGNAIVLGLVVIILAIYRQLDVNNRSLEKVRRYSEKAQQDLDKIVLQKATELRDMTVEVDVNKQAAKEVLKRLALAQDELVDKSQLFEGYSQRIQEYDAALRELLEMTSRAEKNIGRVRDESEYIDKVGKRIKTAAGQLEYLEKRIPQLAEDFSTQNQQQLDAERAKMIAATGQQLETFSAETNALQERIDGFSSFMKEMENRGEHLSQEVEASIRDVYEELMHASEQNADSALKEFRTQIDQKLQDSQSVVSSIEDHADAVVRNAADRVTELKNSAASKTEELFAAFQAQEVEYNQKLADIAERGERMETQAFQQLQQRLQGDVERIRSAQESMLQEAIQKIAENRQTIQTEMQDVQEHFTHQQDQLSRTSEEFIHGLESRYERASAGIDERIQQLIEALGNAEAQSSDYTKSIHDRLSSIQQQGTQQIAETLEQLQNELYTSSSVLREEIHSSEENARRSVDSLLTRVNQDVEAQTESLRSGIEQRMQQLQQNSFDQHERIESMFTGLKSEVEQWINSTREYIGALNSQETQLKERIADVETHIEAVDSTVQDRLSSVSQKLADNQAQLDSRLDKYVGDFTQRIGVFEAEAQETLQKAQSDISKHLGNLDSRVLNDVERLESALQQRIEELATTAEKHSTEIHTGIQKRLSNLEKEAGILHEQMRTDVERRTTELAEQVAAVYSEVQNGIEQQRIDSVGRIREVSTEMEQRLLKDLDARIGETKNAVSVQLQQIHVAAADIDQLEVQLRKDVQRAAESVQQELHVLREGILEQRQNDIQAAGADMEAVRKQMNELESGLDALKERAYENVHAKLKVFEDDFFSDLRSRSEAMENHLLKWQQGVQKALEARKNEQDAQRARIEQQYSEQLQQQIDGLQQAHIQQYEKLQTQASLFENEIAQKYGSVEQGLQDLEGRVHADLEAAHGRSMELVEQELRKYDESLSSQLRELEKEIHGEYRTLLDSSQTARADAQGVIEATRSDVTRWQTEVLEKLKGAENGFDSDIADFKMEVSNTIAVVKDDFARQRDELITRTEQERQSLQQQIQQLSAQATALEQNLNSEVQTAIDAVTIRSEQLQSTFSTGMKKHEQGIELRLREFRGLVQETREQFSALEEKLMGKLEERANLLSLNVSDIEKRQKSFIDQTKIFERADTLKAALQEAIEELKTDLQRVDNQRKEMREIQNQFQRLRKLGDDALEKMGRFTQEKRRIDQLEQDYQELMRLTQAVDSQIKSMTDSHDAMQAMQLELRRIEEMQAAVEEKHERVQAKQEVLASTAKGIDETFQRLQDVEVYTVNLEKQIQAVPPKLDGVLEMLEEIQKDRGTVEQTVSQLGSLNTLLTDVEQRMTQMQKAREWLARTETRFEELNRDANTQLAAMRGVLQDKNDGSGRKKNDTPSVDARDMVVKLSRQGWKVEEIAKATKLSPGEVELILEISHK